MPVALVILLLAVASAFFVVKESGVFAKPTNMTIKTEIDSKECRGTVRIDAELKDDGGKRVPDALIDFYAGKTKVDSLYTDRNGRADLETPINLGWCGQKIDFTAQFSGNGDFKNSSASSDGVVRAPTALVLDMPRSELVGQNFTAYTNLTNAISGLPLVGKNVGIDSLSSRTDVNGTANFPLSFQETGDGEVSAAFQGDEYFEPSTSSARRISIQPITCGDGTLVGKCSNDSICTSDRTLQHKCSVCGCPGGLICANDQCITEEQRTTSLIEMLQKSTVQLRSDDSIGSGVIIGENGSELLVLTNRHVIDPDFASVASKNIEVDNYGGEVAKPLRLLVAPNELDMAIVVIGKRFGPVADIEEGATPKIGSDVLVLGSPLGIPNSVTRGIISNYVPTNTSSGFDYNVTQTDAAVNPGNSGGGVYLLDSGRLIGITAFKLFISKNQLAEGLGFSIPISLVKEFPLDKWTEIEPSG